MKRDWDLVQEILEKAEENDPFSDEGISVESLASDHGPELLAYHVILLTKEGFLHPQPSSDTLQKNFLQSEPAVENGSGTINREEQAQGQMRLTWKGHNLLDILRQRTETSSHNLLEQILNLE